MIVVDEDEPVLLLVREAVGDREPKGDLLCVERGDGENEATGLNVSETENDVESEPLAVELKVPNDAEELGEAEAVDEAGILALKPDGDAASDSPTDSVKTGDKVDNPDADNDSEFIAEKLAPVEASVDNVGAVVNDEESLDDGLRVGAALLELVTVDEREPCKMEPEANADLLEVCVDVSIDVTDAENVEDGVADTERSGEVVVETDGVLDGNGVVCDDTEHVALPADDKEAVGDDIAVVEKDE